MGGETIDGFALGIELEVVKTEDGGRVNPIGGDDYPPMAYRPNWGLPGMTPPEQTGGPVLCFGHYPVSPGDRVRAVVVSMFPDRVPSWSDVRVGDVLPMYDCGGVADHQLLLARTLRDTALGSAACHLWKDGWRGPRC
ncbi:hypothetical protein NHL50_01345 [Acidimicrobiia bacterium EGI L10123]|uniref:hypothetical protein n=1 Tax=Salinilacustrithrix flava TaxID=2957203 RepID=UPI003D7C3084|nr:hypothetical protein [Acidimicrobiia bacterium EGI L10123]